VIEGRRRFVTTIDLFRDTTDSISCEAGQVIFEEGKSGSVMYVILDGEVEILKGESLITTIGPGGIIGEMALIDAGPRSATARAKTACRLVEITERRFMFLVQQTPHFALNVMRIMAERVRRMNEALA
jgi:CRP/FNR family transcriptional regulator, cyclic AMP receptor protein